MINIDCYIKHSDLLTLVIHNACIYLDWTVEALTCRPFKTTAGMEEEWEIREGRIGGEERKGV